MFAYNFKEFGRNFSDVYPLKYLSQIVAKMNKVPSNIFNIYGKKVHFQTLFHMTCEEKFAAKKHKNKKIE